MLDKLWDDVVAGPSPSRGLGKLRKLNTENLTRSSPDGGKLERSLSSGSEMPATPTTPTTPATMTTPSSGRYNKENVWRSVFNPGSNSNTKTVGAHFFDKPTHSSSPTVYDWLYSGDTRNKRM